MTTSFPSKLGRYQIVKHLADGGMAQVLLARSTGIEGFERHVVVKRIHSDRAEDPVFVKMFLDEARLAAQLHHNNIVHVHDIGKEKGEYFFAMEYVHGEDLRRILSSMNKRREKIPFEHIITIITTTALALHHAHEQRGADRKPLGLVHRDVSPANVIVGYDGNVKVVDFGIAKAALRSKPDDSKVGSLKGKVSYMAPEQCAGLAVDRRSDVFSLGIVLFELTTVRRLFKGKNDFMTMSAIVQGQVPKPTTFREDIPVELEAIMMKALANDPEQRYQSADEMREALEQFAAAKGLRMSTGALANYMRGLFGHRPEPWLVEEPEIEMTIDFDNSEWGAAKIPESAVAALAVPAGLLEARPSSPIIRARKKASTDAEALLKAAAAREAPNPVPELVEEPATILEPLVADDLATVVSTELPFDINELTPLPVPLVPRDPILPDTPPPPPPQRDDGWGSGSPTGSGTPLAWPTDATSTTTRGPRTKWFAIAGAGGLVLVIITVFALRGGGESASTSGLPPPASEIVPAAGPPAPLPMVIEATKGEQEAREAAEKEAAAREVAMKEAAAKEAAAKAPPPVAAGSGSGDVKKVIRKKKPKQWNPDELFLPEEPKK